MSVRRLLRLGFRVALVGLAAGVLYVGVTFVQVFAASNQTHEDPAQAIIVLGAAQYDGVPSPVLQGRLDHAIELFDAGVANTLVVTGGKQDGDRFTEAAASYRYLREQGIAEERILREEQGSNTWEQLAAATRELRRRGMSSAVLVSDDYHAYRLDRIAHELARRPWPLVRRRGACDGPGDGGRGRRPGDRIPSPGQPRRPDLARQLTRPTKWVLDVTGSTSIAFGRAPTRRIA